MKVLHSTDSPPLVSVGVPTYNRPELLARALDNLINQTYPNLDIIISDNASPDTSVIKVIEDYAKKDSRIRYFIQPVNKGPAANFFFVLRQARADYFMWAADDDFLEPWFIERCIKCLAEDESVSLATTEVQYITEDGLKLKFVPEGEAFRTRNSSDRMLRLTHLLKYNYGNLVYGVFRKKSLINDSDVFWERTSLLSLNEVPALLLAAALGHIIVSPEIGLYKKVPEAVHAQVVWEVKGGWLPSTGRINGFRSLIQTWAYHRRAMQDVESGIRMLQISDEDKHSLTFASKINLFIHFVFILSCYKPQCVR